MLIEYYLLCSQYEYREEISQEAKRCHDTEAYPLYVPLEHLVVVVRMVIRVAAHILHVFRETVMREDKLFIRICCFMYSTLFPI